MKLHHETTARPISRILAAALPLAALLSACEGSSGCIPTRIRARDAAAVDIEDPERSGLLEARLTARGKPLRGHRVEFYVEHRELVVAGDARDDRVGTDRTGAQGYARLTMSDRGAVQATKDAPSERWGAVFRGSAKYCGSMDEARYRLVNGVPALERGDPPAPPAPVARDPQVPGAPVVPPLPVGVPSLTISSRGSL